MTTINEDNSTIGLRICMTTTINEDNCMKTINEASCMTTTTTTINEDIAACSL